ncbi:MAG: SDR family oxidoreductase [Bacteroidota bacterium]
MTTASQKICLITGANAGIGFATAKGLLAEGFHVIVHARNKEKTEHTHQRLSGEFPEGLITSVYADLSSFQQIKEMVKQLDGSIDHLDVLINNAGMLANSFRTTEEGFEMQFGVNHLAPFLLTHLLLSRLQQAPSARIINVSSDGHYRIKERVDDWNASDNYSGFDAYCRSKLANVLFTHELSRRLIGTSITTNSLHPGVVNTGIGQKDGGFLGILWRLMRPFMVKPQKGASTSVYLATSVEVSDISGSYFDKSTSKAPSRLSRDEAFAKALWDQSVRMTGINNAL